MATDAKAESTIEKKKCFIVVLRCANAECQGKFRVLSPNARPPFPAALVCRGAENVRIDRRVRLSAPRGIKPR
jgi:hypothetical protein